MADINNPGFNSGSGINSDVNSGLSGLSSDVSSSSFSATSTSESFANTPRYTGTETAMNSEAATSGYRQYLDKGADYITRGMDAVAPAFNRGVESMRPVVSRGVTSVRTQAEANPWIAVGVASGVCMLLGYWLGRSLTPARSLSTYSDYNVGMSNTVGATTTPNVGVDINNQDRIASDNLGTNPSY
jgi:ElaB/YqjD/DUF883 family membrane-anchored ribosome-binding protein